ncbi:MAG TPA: PLP-dependent aminotransferase family protein [Noviherbaspirillum sp.]|nr:PLP-dependent aminotransferase family protein [Noviherbaspirillum sp.]
MSVSEGRRTNRYKEIAARLTSQIDAGVFLPDERLPSVRNLMQRENVSVTTALRVFRALEENGRAYARHRSGYFVRPRNSEAAWTPPRETAERRFDGVPVAINHLVVDMLETSAAANILPLGSAVLDRLLIPQSQLSRILISIAKREADKSACYTPPPGLFELRCGIARLMGDRGVLCGPDDIIITAGDGAAIECALRIIARPGDSIAIETPTYFGILQAIEAAGMKAVEIPTDPATGIDVEQLELAVQSQKIAAVLLNPTLQNPLGFTMPAAHRERVVEMLAKARVPLIEDDVFHDLHTGQRQLSAMKSFDKDGMVLYCSSFSKVLTPGYRVGWCLPGRYRRQMMTDFLGRNLSISSLPQLVLAEFLRKDYYEHHTAKLRDMFSLYPSKVDALIKKHFPKDTRVSQPEGGFVYWIELASPISIAALYSAALADGISIAPGPIFFASGSANTTFRICIGRQWTAKIEQAIANIGRLCGMLIASD